MSNKKSKSDRALLAATKRNAALITDSKVFCVLFNPKMIEEVMPVLQMGLAVYMDKPIVVLAPRGATISMNLRRLAVAIEEYDPDDMASLKAATERALRVT